MSDASLPFAPAAARNADAIREVLQDWLPPSGRVLEIGAGTGQHAVHFSGAFPGLTWLATDREASLPGLEARIGAEGNVALEAPRELDVGRQEDWPRGPFQAVYSANTAHIMPWEAVEAMLSGVGRCLAPDRRFFLYGPFQRNGGHTAPSNARFHEALRAQDPAMGVRDLEALEREGQRHQLKLEAVKSMPANNFIAIFHHHV